MRQAPGGELLLRDQGRIDRLRDGSSHVLAHTLLQRSNRDARLFPGRFVEQTTCFRQLDLAPCQPAKDARHLGQDGLQRPDDFLEEADAALEGVIGVLFDGAFHIEVEDFHGGRFLANTVNAADALLDPHRIPRQVVIDECRELL